MIVGEGLNRDEWHNVTVRIDVHGARLIARVDNQQEEVYLKGLKHDTNYGVSTNLPSVVLVGGENVFFNFIAFVIIFCDFLQASVLRRSFTALSTLLNHSWDA